MNEVQEPDDEFKHDPYLANEFEPGIYVPRRTVKHGKPSGRKVNSAQDKGFNKEKPSAEDI